MKRIAILAVLAVVFLSGIVVLGRPLIGKAVIHLKPN